MLLVSHSLALAYFPDLLSSMHAFAHMLPSQWPLFSSLDIFSLGNIHFLLAWELLPDSAWLPSSYSDPGSNTTSSVSPPLTVQSKLAPSLHPSTLNSQLVLFSSIYRGIIRHFLCH